MIANIALDDDLILAQGANLTGLNFRERQLDLSDQTSKKGAHSFATRVASNRNQRRRSASSIQFSIKLAVATSSCSSQIACVSRKLATSCLLSSRSSACMSNGLTKCASLSQTLCKRPI